MGPFQVSKQNGILRRHPIGEPPTRFPDGFFVIHTCHGRPSRLPEVLPKMLSKTSDLIRVVHAKPRSRELTGTPVTASAMGKTGWLGEEADDATGLWKLSPGASAEP